MNHPAAKFVVAVAAAVAVAIQSYFNGSADTITFDEWVQVVVAGLGAATLWLAGNQYAHPVYKFTKTIVLGLTAGATALVSYAANGGTLEDVNWWNIAIVAVGAVLVAVAPPSPDNQPAVPPAA